MERIVIGRLGAHGANLRIILTQQKAESVIHQRNRHERVRQGLKKDPIESKSLMRKRGFSLDHRHPPKAVSLKDEGAQNPTRATS